MIKPLHFILTFALCLLTFALPSGLWSAVSWEQQYVEDALQGRLETALSKLMRPEDFVAAVRAQVEIRVVPPAGKGRAMATAQPVNAQRTFVLPGVPSREKSPLTKSQTVVVTPSSNESNAPTREVTIKKLSVYLLIDQRLSEERMKDLKTVVFAILPIDLTQGDELNIQRVRLATREGEASAGSLPASAAEDHWQDLLLKISPVNLLAVLGLLLFLFGPFRRNINRTSTTLAAMMSRLGRAPAEKPAAGAPGAAGKALPGGLGVPIPGAAGASSANGNGHRFGFVKEEDLPRLMVLLQRLPSAKAAHILGYLPPAMAGRVLSACDPDQQIAWIGELAQTQQVSPSEVDELEKDIKEKIGYLVGGTEWTSSVYFALDSGTQKRLLQVLTQADAALARKLRESTFFLDDMTALDPGSLRLLVQAAGAPVVASALQIKDAGFRHQILRALPKDMVDILNEEFDSATGALEDMQTAQARLEETGRNLMRESRLRFRNVAAPPEQLSEPPPAEPPPVEPPAAESPGTEA